MPLNYERKPHKLSSLVGKKVKTIKCIEDSCFGSSEVEVSYVFEMEDGTTATLYFTEGHCCA